MAENSNITNTPENFYFHGNELDQFYHIQIPVTLLKEKVFSRYLSDAAVILYGILLNRMSLSFQHNWKDEEGRTYIIYTVENLAKELNYSEAKAKRLFKELSDVGGTGYGLIKKVRVLNKPSRIYVFNFMSVFQTLTELEKCDDIEDEEEEKGCEPLKTLDSSNMTRPSAQMCTDGQLKSEPTDSSNMSRRSAHICTVNNNNINNNNISNNNLSISQGEPEEGEKEALATGEYVYEDFKDGVLYPINQLEDFFPYTDLRDMLTYHHFIDECGYFDLSQSEKKERALEELKWLISYPSFAAAHPHDVSLVDAMLDYMTDIVALNESIKFKDTTYHADMMGKRFFELDYNTIEYVLESVRDSSQSVRIRDIRKYYIKCLLTARSNMNTGIHSQVTYDMANWNEQ